MPKMPDSSDVLHAARRAENAGQQRRADHHKA
jgi:hypothetical protein